MIKQQGRNKLPKEVRITNLPPEIIRCVFGRHVAARCGLLSLPWEWLRWMAFARMSNFSYCLVRPSS